MRAETRTACSNVAHYSFEMSLHVETKAHAGAHMKSGASLLHRVACLAGSGLASQVVHGYTDD